MFLCDTPEQAWVYINRVVEPPSRNLATLLSQHPVEKVAYGIYHQESWIGPVLGESAARRDWLRQQEDLDTLARIGARLITPESTEWPDFDRAFRFFGNSDAPTTFDREAIPPVCLWVRGRPLKETAAQSVAVVGTRAISPYGTQATRKVVADLAKHQWTIVSGGALGVDTVAHSAALEMHTPTIAVAACGIDYDYPARNAPLFHRIAQTGTVVSEFAPGTTPQRHRFLSRNRLVAAMTAGTVVVEAAFRSGALNTLNWAEALGKVAMAVPGPITTAGSLGCHQRIQENRAQLVTSGEEIRELIGKIGEADSGAQYELDFAANPVQSLSRNELKVYDAVPVDSGHTAEDIARDAGMRVPLVVHLLVILEKQALIRREGKNWIKLLNHE
ncbi:DNA-processing protein DprA [Corynebacterium stationis]|mgnify:CR=1 FL=1|uniref:DNA-processing protein DprA n=1 Tax=Corynebacterium stationis TaxID=1705 RepID=UPI00076F6678|nr:DNA-processing protein DprA [Corynebacterium stationis]AMJ44410.1 DNA processing protein DprA [Corynebacterium stationis]AQX70867.1 DNA-processing protein DprA [Corynebacterium stationis]ASJ18556.1 DNA protecting protein DprA [Corynebacterium stationis]HJG64280.1 DNA-processing protein DprA [Corynebacterium stationis]